MARKRKPADDLAAVANNPAQDIPAGPIKADFATMMPGYPKRHDGWNQQRLQRFLDVLAHTGCVEDACRVAGMSDVAPYRAKKRYPLFAAAWDDALERSRQGLIAIAYQRAVEGRETVIIRKGEEYERRISPSDAILGLMIKRGDMVGGGGLSAEFKDLAGLSRAEIISWPEWRDQRIRFTQRGKKYEAPDPVETSRLLDERCLKLMNGLRERAKQGELCPCCDQKLPPEWPTQSLMAMTLLGLVDIKDHFEGIPLGDR